MFNFSLTSSTRDHIDPRSVVLSPADVVKAGFVMKQSKHLLQWKRRWLVLTKDLLCSFSTKEWTRRPECFTLSPTPQQKESRGSVKLAAK
ncbi:hypothetical protein Pmar_PMAR011584 [Perkinsus marinus ATCC 50983]|uniref:PH domain-containing protein n=1 Tax=Perkinsus marinus (strain ATCC 50983 / TXsc) TaxID=423536 RepID=C5LC73_PERM5|nr:hypothetical protein Pmar_PMAR011584 [Perkinsus marinus ATCC 50983]EER05556.1 hypothetical protein Pmar_PMAR011584 [Perkinsus marinus ATCC 50983]|eukprot:XP_002773740.1 hypothetical protein Pmar_PMAR011584 [Perkinsus marinus ATCC 50983]